MSAGPWCYNVCAHVQGPVSRYARLQSPQVCESILFSIFVFIKWQRICLDTLIQNTELHALSWGGLALMWDCVLCLLRLSSWVTGSCKVSFTCELIAVLILQQDLGCAKDLLLWRFSASCLSPAMNARFLVKHTRCLVYIYQESSSSWLLSLLICHTLVRRWPRCTFRNHSILRSDVVIVFFSEEPVWMCDPQCRSSTTWTNQEWSCKQCFRLAEISLRPPRKKCIFIITKYIYRIKVPNKKNI